MEEIQRQDLVDYLKLVLGVNDTTDVVLKSVTDQQLESLLIQKAKYLGLPYPHISTEEEDLVVVLSRKEMYWKLATATAPLYPLDLEGLKVQKNVRFDHYLALIKLMESEYSSMQSDPNRGSSTVKVGSILINKPYTRSTYMRNYKLPTIKASIDKVSSDYAELTITYLDLQIGDFSEILVYVSNEPIWDIYDETINTKAKIVTRETNARRQNFRVKGLTPMTTNYVLFNLKLRNGNTVFKEVEVVPNDL